MFATATLLLPLSKLGMSSEVTPPLLRYVEMAVEILEAMDESVVARKSVEIITHYLRRFRGSDQNVANDIGNEFPAAETESQPRADVPVSIHY